MYLGAGKTTRLRVVGGVPYLIGNSFSLSGRGKLATVDKWIDAISDGADEVAQWSLTTMRDKLVKIGARIVRHGRYHVFQLAEVAVPRALFAGILRRIDRLCSGLTGADHRGGRSRGENHAPRSTSGTRAARIGLRAWVQRLLAPGIRRQTGVPIDQRSTEEQLFGCQPSPPGECRLRR